MLKAKLNQKLNSIVNQKENKQNSQKDKQLSQNNQLQNNREKANADQELNTNFEVLTQCPSLFRKASIRPRSSLARNLAQTSFVKPQKTDEELIKQKIKQKLVAGKNLQRPSTSKNNQKCSIREEKKQKLLGRRGNINNLNSTAMNQLPKNKNLGSKFQIDRITNLNQEDSQYVSNQKVLDMITSIIDHDEDFLRLKISNQREFERIKQKIVSNTSIIVLKWFQILEDSLKKSDKNKSEKYEYQSLKPKTIEELVICQIRKLFSKQEGVFMAQQRCNLQQNKLSKLIDCRLQKLENLLGK